MCKFPASERTQKRRFSKPRIVTHSRTHGFVRASRHTKKWVTRAQEARAKKIRRLYLAKCEKISAWVCTSKQIFSKLLPWRPGLANASFLAGFPTQLETSQREHRRREHRKFGGFTPWLVQISSEEMHLEANIFKTFTNACFWRVSPTKENSSFASAKRGEQSGQKGFSYSNARQHRTIHARGNQQA